MADRDDEHDGTRDDAPEGDHVRMGGGGKPVAADDVRDPSVEGEDATTAANRATPPTEGPAAAGSLPG